MTGRGTRSQADVFFCSVHTTKQYILQTLISKVRQWDKLVLLNSLFYASPSSPLIGDTIVKLVNICVPLYSPLSWMKLAGFPYVLGPNQGVVEQ